MASLMMTKARHQLSTRRRSTRRFPSPSQPAILRLTGPGRILGLGDDPSRRAEGVVPNPSTGRRLESAPKAGAKVCSVSRRQVQDLQKGGRFAPPPRGAGHGFGTHADEKSVEQVDRETVRFRHLPSLLGASSAWTLDGGTPVLQVVPRGPEPMIARSSSRTQVDP